MKTKTLVLASAFAAALALRPTPLLAHCDTLDGPVASDATKALASGDVTPVLKWVQPKDEAAIRSAFAEAAKVRALSPEARSLSDRWFLETLVRVHRAGEGAPFTGLKPAGSAEPVFRHADESLDEGSVDPLVDELAKEVAHGMKSRYTRVKQLRAVAGQDVAKGRQAVAAYVDYLHYVEGLHAAIEGETHHAD